MDRSKLADLSEIVSSIAIVVTLVYLTVEIRQNTNALYAESRQSVLTAAQTELFALVENPNLIVSVAKDDPLTEEEQVALGAWLAAAMRAREFSWLQYRDGVIDEAQWETEVIIIRWLLDSERTRDWWANSGRFQSNLSFVAFVDAELQSHPTTLDSWRRETNWTKR